MIDYDAVFTNTDGNPFPDTGAVNSTGPSTTDGTEFIAALVNDIWGARQHLMNQAGLTPDSVTEANGASQAYTAMENCFSAPGTLVPWVGADDQPINLGIRLIPLKGQVLLISDFVTLVDNTYVGDGDNATAPAYFKTSDAGGTVRDTAGTYFVLPDMRGLFLRGKDPTAIWDPDGASREMGDSQAFDVGAHQHQVKDINDNWFTKTVLSDNAASGTDISVVEQSVTQIGASLVGKSTSTVTETRPSNTICWWCIRF